MTLPRFLSAAPDAALGIGFLLTWIAPHVLGVQMLRYAVLSILLEFVVVHSAAFMGMVGLAPTLTAARKIAAVLGLGAVYTIFVASFALIFGEWWPLAAFWSLTLNRLTGVLLHTAPEGEERQRVAAEWALSAAAYVAWVLATAFLPVPALGLDATIVAEVQLPGSGLWVESPQTAVAAGVGYYLSQAFFELKGMSLSRQSPQSMRRPSSQ